MQSFNKSQFVIEPKELAMNRSASRKSSNLELSYLEDTHIIKSKFLSACNTSHSFHLNNSIHSRTSSVTKQGRKESTNDCSTGVQESDTMLPAISEYRTAPSLKAKQSMYTSHIDAKKNESLLRSMKHLQQSQDYEWKFKSSPLAIKEKLLKSVRHLKSFAKKPAAREKNLSVCRYTEDRYIKDVYIKNRVPSIDRPQGKKRRKTKLRKLNKSQIHVEKLKCNNPLFCV